MTEDEFKKIVLEKFDSLDKRFDWVDERFVWIGKKFDWIDKKFDWIDKRFDWIDRKLTKISDDLLEFKQETSQNFEYTQKQIDQAFEKISDNMEYQDKVDTVVNILRNNTPTSKIFSRKRKVAV